MLEISKYHYKSLWRKIKNKINIKMV
jgi:hypothetical protein